MNSLLLAEDDPHIALLVEYALQRLDCQVECHRSVDAILARLRRGPPPRLVVLDLHLDGADGLDVLREMKQDAALAAVPVVILSASPLESNKRDARALGAAEFIAKPFDVERFAAAVSRVGGIQPIPAT
jgi:DNA-binding response OmpR family regulator